MLEKRVHQPEPIRVRRADGRRLAIAWRGSPPTGTQVAGHSAQANIFKSSVPGAGRQRYTLLLTPTEGSGIPPAHSPFVRTHPFLTLMRPYKAFYGSIKASYGLIWPPNRL